MAVALTVAATTLPLSHAQGDAGNAYKIGVVNGIAIFEGYQKQQDQLSALRQRVQTQQEEIDSQLRQLDTEREQLRSRRDSMSAEEFDRQRDAWERRVEELTLQGRRIQSDVDRESNRIMESLREDIFRAIQTIGARENYHLILEADQNPLAQSSVMYHSATLDLTQQVVDFLNAEYAQTRSQRSR